MEEGNIISVLSSFANYFGFGDTVLPGLFFFTLIIVLYGVVIYYFYKFLSKKDIADINLLRFSKTENGVVKFLAGLFYFIEYILFVPFLTSISFAILAIVLMLIAKNLDVSTILVVAAALVASVRATSYVGRSISQDLAKMIPLTLLALAITGENFLSISLFLGRFSQIPALLSQIPIYLLFIISIEVGMRIIYSLLKFFSSSEIPKQ